MGLLGGLRGEYTVAKIKSNGSTGEVLSTKAKVANVIITVLLFLGAIVMVFPLIYMILMSLMTIRETISTTFVLIPEEWQWHNYVDIFSDSQFYNGVVQLRYRCGSHSDHRLLYLFLGGVCFCKTSLPRKERILHVLAGNHDDSLCIHHDSAVCYVQ